MKIGIHYSNNSFSDRWIAYCKAHSIEFKIVNCYKSNIIQQLEDCDALMWHYHQSNKSDIIMAKPLLFALEQAGIKVFPDFNTAWHFDDKVGQKYLMEALKIPIVPTWVFYSKEDALEWINTADFPKVFKLRGGAGSQNVSLVKSLNEANRLVNKAFRKGFSPYNAWGSFKERIRKWRLGKESFKEVIKGLVRLVFPPAYAKVMGREVNYIYFQEFIPGNDSDTRIIVIGAKAFAIKRMVRENDFRASGSGSIKYERKEFDERCVQMSFNYTKLLKGQSVAFDFVFDKKNIPLLVEISYGFAHKVYDPCTGYWDEQLNWHPGDINPYGWMVDDLVQSIR